jgi:hypothetical protein
MVETFQIFFFYFCYSAKGAAEEAERGLEG